MSERSDYVGVWLTEQLAQMLDDYIAQFEAIGANKSQIIRTALYEYLRSHGGAYGNIPNKSV